MEPFVYLFNYLNKSYKDVCYLGDKVYIDIADKRKSKSYNNVSFYVNSSKEELCDRFLEGELYDNYLKLEWGLKYYNIYWDKDILTKNYNCTCFNVNKDEYGFIDSIYNTFDLSISSIKDINNHLIRLNSNNYDELLQNNPDIILKIFELKSINNFTIEPYTLYYMNKYKNDIKNFSLFYSIFKNEYVIETLEFIKATNFFKDTNFIDIFNKLYSFKEIIERAKKAKVSFMEQYFIIFNDNLYNNNIYKEYLSDYDKYCVCWCDKNYNILTRDKKELRFNIYNSMDDIILKHDIHLLKNCLIRLNNIHILQQDKKAIPKDILFYCLCGRPYFKEQLHITDKEIMEIFKTKDVNNIKDKIIKYILSLEKYPQTLIDEVKENYKKILEV